MTINTEDLLNSILESVGRIDYIHPVDIPNIDLYMDQVTTFMEEQLSSTKRYEDDKIQMCIRDRDKYVLIGRKYV